MKNIAKVIVKAHHEKRLIEGNPWIFSNEIDNFSSLKNLENPIELILSKLILFKFLLDIPPNAQIL